MQSGQLLPQVGQSSGKRLGDLLRWKIKYSEREQFLETIRAQGRSVKLLDSRPSLAWEVPIWNAWNALHKQRDSSWGGASPLSVVDARAYLEAHGFEGRALAEALTLLIDMDGLARELFDGKGSDAKAGG